MRPRAEQLASGVALALALALGGCRGAARGACDPTPPAGRVGSLCGFHDPEDVEVVAGAGLLVVSEMHGAAGGPGALAGISLEAAAQGDATSRRLWPRDAADAEGPGPGVPLVGDPACAMPPAAGAFAPHGLGSTLLPRGPWRLAVVSHAPREAIELFDLSGRGDDASLRWRGCVPLPHGASGNDVAFTRDGGLVVSDFVPTSQGLRGRLWMLAAGAGIPTGKLLVWSRDEGWRHVPGTRAAGPNGVAASPDGSFLFYAETGRGRIVRVPRAGLAPGQMPAVATIGGLPDNLAWTSSGTLLAVSHTDGLAFLGCAFGRSPCRSGWALFEVDPITLHVTPDLRHDGSAVGAVASAAQWGRHFFFGAVFGDRIGVWAPAP